MAAQPKLCVIGSSNMDLISRVERMPRLGETIEGETFAMGFGGKGANQAIAAAKLGADVLMLSKVGDDVFGPGYRDNLAAHGVDVRHVGIVAAAPTGVASIFVDARANNSIIHVKGANQYLLPADVDAAADDIRKCLLIVLQLEVPIETVYHALRFGHENGIPVILNPAPAASLDFDAVRHATFLVPHETELEILTGMPVATIEDARAAGRALLDRGIGNVLVTLGANGSLWLGREGEHHAPAVPVAPVDTTGAGDAFIGSFAFHYLASNDIAGAMDRANRYAALSTTRPGAQGAMPTAEEFAAALAAE